MTSSDDVRASHCLFGARDQVVERVGQVITRHDDQATAVPGGHDAQPARLEVEGRGTCDARQRVHDDHHGALEALPPLRRIDAQAPAQIPGSRAFSSVFMTRWVAARPMWRGSRVRHRTILVKPSVALEYARGHPCRNVGNVLVAAPRGGPASGWVP